MISLSFCCPLASRLSTKILHLIGRMKEIINRWMNIWGKSKHLFLICSDKTFPPGVNICSENSQKKTTSHLIICHNYAAHCDERISMIYLCHRKRVQLQTWKLLKPMRVSSQWMIKGAKAYQRCFLTLKQCHMALEIHYHIRSVFAQEHNGYCAFWNSCLFTQLKLQKAHKVERGHKPFIMIKG